MTVQDNTPQSPPTLLSSKLGVNSYGEGLFYTAAAAAGAYLSNQFNVPAGLLGGAAIGVVATGLIDLTAGVITEALGHIQEPGHPK